MNRFSQLFAELDATTSTNAKVEAIQRYLDAVPAHDAAWAVYFLAGGKPRQVVRTATLRTLACEVAGLQEWLFEECYQAVGDLAETIAHVLPPSLAHASSLGLAQWVEERLLPLRGLPDEEIAQRIKSYWLELDTPGRFLLTKLVGGGFRVGVSKLLVQRAIAAHAGIDAKRVAQRMMGYTDGKAMPTAIKYEAVRAVFTRADGLNDLNFDVLDAGQPYPFFLAHQLDAPLADLPAKLGEVANWQVEWKFDGIRGQLVKRAGQVWVWSRGEELLTDRFPELVALMQPLADGTVLDGEIVVWLALQSLPPPLREGGGSALQNPTEALWPDGHPAPFAQLQTRITRKTLPKKLLADAPVSFIAYDLLEAGGQDLREQPQHARRAQLEGLLTNSGIRLSPLIRADTWQALADQRMQARTRGVEGLMLKNQQSAYGTGRTKADGTWWKWKVDPLTVDCILIYAQAGHGRRASVYTDYTFAVWSRPPVDKAEADAVLEAIEKREPAQPGKLQLVAFAKAYSGLTDEEFKQVDAVIRKTTLEKFGPVRSVKPSLVFELGFEGINHSPRHKSGVAVRFPRMLRRRLDKPLHEAACLADLKVLMGL